MLPAATGFAGHESGNPANMQQTDSRKIAVAGVLVTAVLAACLALPAVDQLSTIEGTWLAAAILCLPTAAALVATGYRHYGLVRSIIVALAIMLVTGLITWVVAVFTVASALSGSTVGPAMGILLLGAPALSVIVFGLLALRFVPTGSAAADRQFEQASSG
jgi:Kef-type K+ transport system membrane component KefB